MTSEASALIQLVANAQGALGFWTGTVTYRPRPLSGGVHDVTLTVGDVAGNLVSQSVIVILDTIAPPLAIEAYAIGTVAHSVGKDFRVRARISHYLAAEQVRRPVVIVVGIYGYSVE